MRMRAMTSVALPAQSEREHQVQLRRAVIASTVGTAIECYGFFLHSTVTGLVLPRCSTRTPIRWWDAGSVRRHRHDARLDRQGHRSRLPLNRVTPATVRGPCHPQPYLLDCASGQGPRGGTN